MKIFITGGNGQIAFDLKKLLQKNGMKFFAPTREELDITNADAMLSMVGKYEPDVVINLAAYTQVDRAESEIEKAIATNYRGVKNIITACTKLSCRLIQVSTDYIFNGETTDAYTETDKAQPLNVYGKSKLLAEEYIISYLSEFIILRVSAVFGMHGNNFVKTILRLAQEKSELKVIDDQFTCPTSAVRIAETLLQLVPEKKSGIFHYCSEQPISWYNFSKKIIEIGGKFNTFSLQNLQAVPAVEYKTPAKRPRYSVLNCQKINKTLGIQQPNWEEDLRHVIQQLSNA